MKNYPHLILLALMCALFPVRASASTLDELYRDIIKSDNEGYLPVFVKNRNIPDLLLEEEVLKKLPETKDNTNTRPLPGPVSLTNHRLEAEAARKAALLRWENTLKTVQENRVTPLELEEINRRVALKDPKAVEILAWMNARGIGVSPNLPEAFRLYQFAVILKVPGAADNALKVYKAMKPEQRSQLKTFSLPENPSQN